MLTRIITNSQELCTFVAQLGLPLSAPQRRHVINVADGLLVTDAPKTLAEIQRQFVSCVDVSNIADTFRIAPWTAEEIRGPLARFLMRAALERLARQGQPLRLLINLDDPLAIKRLHFVCKYRPARTDPHRRGRVRPFRRLVLIGPPAQIHPMSGLARHLSSPTQPQVEWSEHQRV